MAYKFNKWQKAWLEALESGEYAQTRNYLCDGNGFCCLGVACEVLGLEAEWNETHGCWEYEGQRSNLPKTAVKKLKLWSEGGLFSPQIAVDLYSLVNVNDKHRWSFKKIAEFIRKHPEQVFL